MKFRPRSTHGIALLRSKILTRMIENLGVRGEEPGDRGAIFWHRTPSSFATDICYNSKIKEAKSIYAL